MMKMTRLNGLLNTSFLLISVAALAPRVLNASEEATQNTTPAMSTQDSTLGGENLSLDGFVEPGHGGGGGHGGPVPGHGGPVPGHGGPVPGHGGPVPGHGAPGYHHPPFVGHGGFYPWPRWGHPVFVRPVFAWQWVSLSAVTCTAETSNGEVFPLTENGYIGDVYQAHMEQIEDATLNQCYAESNGDTTCHLIGCTPLY